MGSVYLIVIVVGEFIPEPLISVITGAGGEVTTSIFVDARLVPIEFVKVIIIL